MTTIAGRGAAELAPTFPAGLVRPGLVGLGLAAIVAVRWAVTMAGETDALVVGLGFGVALLALAAAGGVRRVERPSGRALAIGAGGGAVLVAVALAGRIGEPSPTLGLAAPFVPWALITILVGTAEELVLRGVMFRLLMRAGGGVTAVLVTTVAFALMHVPLYGWHVVPLDLGVGLWLAGLRLVSGGAAAPAAAHSLADLATWWLS